MRLNRLWGHNRTKADSGAPGDYLVVGDPKQPSTWHLRVRQGGKVDHGLMGGAWAALHEGYRGNVYAGPDKAAALAKLTALYKSEGMPTPGSATSKSLTVVKQANGDYRWVLISSNAFQDRDGEIISQKALEADVARADATGDYGPLLYWHLDGAPDEQGHPTPRVQLGDCDFNAMHGRMLIESGTFKSRAIGQHVKALADHGVSIGFRHPISEPGPEKVFKTALRYERSLLPMDFASNTLTALVTTEKESFMVKEKIDALRKVLGGDEALVTSVIELADTKEKAALLAGTRTKAKKSDAEPDPNDPNEAAENESPGDNAKADKPYSKDQATDSTDPKKSKKETDFVGDMTLATFKEFLAEALEPQLAAVRTEFTAALGTQATTKAAADAALAETIKSYETKLDKIGESAKAALDGVAELKGELPRALGERQKGHRASQKGDAPDEALQRKAAEQQPNEDADDPFAKAWKATRAAAGRAPVA